MGAVYLGCDTPLPYAAGESPFHIKGEFYRGMRDMLVQVDKQSDGALRKRLDAEGVAAFATQTFLPSQMYDVLPLPRITMAIGAVLNEDLHAFTQKMGRAGLRTQLDGVYKQVFANITTDNVARKFNEIVQLFYDFGHVRVMPRSSSNELSIVRTRVPYCIAEWWCLVTVPFVRIPLELGGTQVIEVTWDVKFTSAGIKVPLADCSWKITWK